MSNLNRQTDLNRPVMALLDEDLSRVSSVAPAMARLLLRLEADALADARPCPVCGVIEPDPDDDGQLPHAVECELDRTLFDAGLRSSWKPVPGVSSSDPFREETGARATSG